MKNSGICHKGYLWRTVFLSCALLTGFTSCYLPHDTRRTHNDSQQDNAEHVSMQPASSKDSSDFFAGSKSCASCHSSVFEQWKKTKHSSRFDESVMANHSGDCIRCHTTSSDELNIGCESCHGPLGTHAIDPAAITKPICRICDIRVECIRCHTRSVDPEFNFSLDYKLVKHENNAKH